MYVYVYRRRHCAVSVDTTWEKILELQSTEPTFAMTFVPVPVFCSVSVSFIYPLGLGRAILGQGVILNLHSILESWGITRTNDISWSLLVGLRKFEVGLIFL